MDDRRSPAEGELFAAFDIETRPDPHALALLGAKPGAKVGATAHAVNTAAFLIGRELPDGSWTGFSLRSYSDPQLDEQGILRSIDRTLLEIGAASGTCWTFNGLAHDFGVIRRRAARHWMMECAGIEAVRSLRHVDLMKTMTRGWRDDWPSLKSACAGLGIPVNDKLMDSFGDEMTRAERKCQTDVTCTFILMLYELAMKRRDLTVLVNGWTALADFVTSPGVREPHLVQFAEHELLRAARRDRRLAASAK